MKFDHTGEVKQPIKIGGNDDSGITLFECLWIILVGFTIGFTLGSILI
jgi:hypothetical protein